MRRLARAVALVLPAAALAGGCGPSQGTGSPQPALGVAESPLTVCPAGATLPGIDVSKFQGTIDWSKVAGAGIAWAYAEGSRCAANTNDQVVLDPDFAANWAGMKASGIVRGAYHRLCASQDGKAQADAFLNHVGPIAATDLPPMLDWEDPDGATRVAGEKNAQAFLDEVKARTGRDPIIYTSPGLWPSLSADSFAGYRLWVADWNVSCPVMPTGWKSWVFWQHADNGTVPGISGNVDLDWFDGDRAALGALSGGATCGGPVGHPVGQGGPTTGTCLGAPLQVNGPSACGTLAPGEGLLPGMSLASCDHRFVLTLTSAGDLKLFAHGTLVWTAGTLASPAFELAVETGGDVVLLSPGGCPLWHTGTDGQAGATLSVTDGGDLTVTAGGTVLWSTGTGAIPEVPASCGTFHGGEGLGPGDGLSSCGGCLDLTLQGGDLVLQTAAGSRLWDTGTGTGYALGLGAGGDLVLYDRDGCTLWDSGTEGNPGATATIGRDGNLVVDAAGGKTLWSSGTVVCAGGCVCGSDGGTGDGGTGDGGSGDGGLPEGGPVETPLPGGGSGGCGCAATGGAPSLAFTVLLLGLALGRRRS